MATQEITATISGGVKGTATATLRNTYTTSLTNDSLTVSGTLSLIIDGTVGGGVGAVAQLSDSSVSVFGSQLIATGEKTVSTSKNTTSTAVTVHAELTLGTYSKVITRTHSSQSVVVSMTSSALRAAVVWTGSAVSDPVSQTKSNTISLAAKPSYTISYNANGGSSTPASQTKWYNEALTLASAITRDKYLFSGWKWNNTGTAVAAGSSWNAANANGTFYAAWEYKYQSPSIIRVTAWRTGTTASGGVYPKQDDGTNADIQVVLTAGKEKAVAGGAYSVANTTVKFYYKLTTASTYTLVSTQTLSSATGTLTVHISSTLDTEKQYDVKVEAYITASATQSTSFTTFISTAFSLVDMTQNGVAFGRAAENDKFMCALPTTIQSTLTVSGNLNINGSVMTDFVITQGLSESWYYRKWKSGKVEAWRTYNAGSQTPSQWVTGWYYKDFTVAIPSGIFSSAPNTTIATNNGSDIQFMVFTARATSTTSITVRVVKPNSGAATPVIALYVCNMV